MNPSQTSNVDRSRTDAEHRVSAGVGQATLRVALYSHDAMGVGHVRRNLLIAQTLSQTPTEATSLLLCGVHEATAFTNGHGVDCLALPSFQKIGNGDYQPRDLRLDSHWVASIRSNIIKTALRSYRPDLLIVDKVPCGIHRELAELLPALRNSGTKVVFGMRDILDDVDCVRQEWQDKQYEKFLRDNYDQIWVYGCPKIFDPIAAYDLGSLKEMVRYTGYLDQRVRLNFARSIDNSSNESYGNLSRTILCMLGGGEDGLPLALAFANSTLPDGYRGLLVAGPLMPEDDLASLCQIVDARDDITLVRQLPDADVIVPDVAKVICMGGYNSVLSVVSFQKTALIVPRVTPRKEQLIRAELFAEHGLVEILHPNQLSPATLSDWMVSESNPTKPQRTSIDLEGLAKIPQFAAALCDENRPVAPATHKEVV